MSVYFGLSCSCRCLGFHFRVSNEVSLKIRKKKLKIEKALIPGAVAASWSGDFCIMLHKVQSSDLRSWLSYRRSLQINVIFWKIFFLHFFCGDIFLTKIKLPTFCVINNSVYSFETAVEHLQTLLGKCSSCVRPGERGIFSDWSAGLCLYLWLFCQQEGLRLPKRGWRTDKY